MSSTENRLARETSPYLLQHAHNPVDWYPWGPEALARAREEDKPIFLSVGYSACHWCHVMEHESFEDPQIAALMNRLFVNIKVDREERPDIDEIYMRAVTALSGAGGWPMSVFLTPSLEPFYGTTYLPPVRRYGRPSFPDVLVALANAWETQRDEVVAQAAKLREHIAAEAEADVSGELADDVLDASLRELLAQLDGTWGGFGSAPKFPHSGDIRLLLRHHARTGDAAARQAALLSLDRMALGGIYDQLGGGFHRYSTDAQWRIPHFEKMLYDNALLMPAYLEAFLIMGQPMYARIARECADWALREMVTPEGGFASAQDADSEGEEGRFFVWTPEQLVEALGPERGRWAAAYYDVTEEGNFEHGKSALWRPRDSAAVAEALEISEETLETAMAEARETLRAARARRVAPATDDKVLVAWNGLMISALSQTYQVLEDADCLAAAQRAARYVLERMRQPDGRLFATARAGRAHLNACLDDYVFMTQGLLDLYESDFDQGWLRHALALCELTESRFADGERGGYFTTGEGHETLIARMKNLHDGALPSATGVQALNLLRLYHLTARGELVDAAERALRAHGALVNRHPRLFSQLLMALDFRRAGPREIVIAAGPRRGATDDAAQALLRAVRQTFMPARVVALARPDEDSTLLPVIEGRSGGDEVRAFVCRDFVCHTPVSDHDALVRALRSPVGPA